MNQETKDAIWTLVNNSEITPEDKYTQIVELVRPVGEEYLKNFVSTLGSTMLQKRNPETGNMEMVNTGDMKLFSTTDISQKADLFNQAERLK